MITSLSNRSVKEVVQLSGKARERNQQDLFVVEGMKMFGEAPAGRIRKVYISQSMEKEVYRRYEKKLAGLNCELVADEVFAKMSDTKSPQGILCLVRQYHYQIEQLLAQKEEKQLLLIVLEDIQDPGNLGTIIRTGEGAGVNGVIMSGRTADIYNPKTIRSTMGSVYRVPFLYTQDIRQTIQELQNQGVAVYAAHLGGSGYYDEYDYRNPTAFLLGNEGNGLREATAECADACVKIPMEGRVESLNVAAASAVLMYEAYRQRRQI
ncbi:MAG: RNA methyltransferase [Clostridiales bacterium]|nr:RNA methyltransferase [Clostridiales bacterium]